MDSNFRAKKWCSPGALWIEGGVGKKKEREERQGGKGNRGAKKEGGNPS